MAVFEVLLSAHEVAETRRKVQKLRGRMAGKRPHDKVEVKVATLAQLLRFVEAATVQPVAGDGRAEALKSQASSEEISPQDAAGILGMSRPSVMRLIAQGHLHPRKVLSRNKLSRAEVIAYRDSNAGQRCEALQTLSALSEGHDL